MITASRRHTAANQRKRSCCRLHSLLPLQLSSVAMLSLTKTGIPWSGPRTCPLRRSLSRCWAMHTALDLFRLPNAATDSATGCDPGNPSPSPCWSTDPKPLRPEARDCSFQQIRNPAQLKADRETSEVSPPLNSAALLSAVVPRNFRRVIMWSRSDDSESCLFMVFSGCAVSRMNRRDLILVTCV